ncbi:TPA: hypothetical protein N0F65_000603, partial [Lagenidium giganteum]
FESAMASMMEKDIDGCEMYIESVKEDTLAYESFLASTKKDIADANRSVEEMAIDTCTLRVRMKELELDEEMVKQSETEAVMEKIIAQKRLVEIGGYDSAVRALKKALQDSKTELAMTQSEKMSVISEERKLEQELHNLGLILQRCRRNTANLQDEYAAIMKSKQEVDAKLKQLPMFLHGNQDLLSSSYSYSSSSSCSSPRGAYSPSKRTRGAHQDASCCNLSPLSVAEASTEAHGKTRETTGTTAHEAAAAMDKYRRVEKTKKEDETPVEPNEIRITQQGKVRNYITYANGLFADKNEKSVVLKAMGNAISKAVTVAEILKHRIAHLHQITQISSIETIDAYEPLEEGLDRIETKRHIPCISIQLSLDKLNEQDPGYQPPIPVELVSAGHDEKEERKPKFNRGHRRTGSGKVQAATSGSEESDRDDTAAAGAASGNAKPVRGTYAKRGRGGRGGRGGRKPRTDSKSGAEDEPKSKPSQNNQKKKEDGEQPKDAAKQKKKPAKKPLADKNEAAEDNKDDADLRRAVTKAKNDLVAVAEDVDEARVVEVPDAAVVAERQERNQLLLPQQVQRNKPVPSHQAHQFPTRVMVTLCCAVVGTMGSVLAVDIEARKYVAELKKAIGTEQKYTYAPSELQLYLAKKGEALLESCDAARWSGLEIGFDHCFLINVPKNFGYDLEPHEGENHVLVVGPTVGNVRLQTWQQLNVMASNKSDEGINPKDPSTPSQTSLCTDIIRSLGESHVRKPCLGETADAKNEALVLNISFFGGNVVQHLGIGDIRQRVVCGDFQTGVRNGLAGRSIDTSIANVYLVLDDTQVIYKHRASSPRLKSAVFVQLHHQTRPTDTAHAAASKQRQQADADAAVASMASRFWAGGSSSDEDSDNSSGSDVENVNQQAARAASRWAVQSDSESEEEVRVVKSAKDKAFENIERGCNALKNHMKINDWTKILSEFDQMSKAMDKAKNVIAASGYPTFYVRAMMCIRDRNKAEQKKMSKENSKALIRMKGKVKAVKETLERQMEEFRKNPVESAEEESSEEEDSSEEDSDEDSDEESEEASDDSEEASEEASEEESEESGSDDDDDDDSSDGSWPSQSDSSSDSSSEDDGELKGRAKWLKQVPAEGSKKKDKGPKQPRAAREIKQRRPSFEQEKKVEEELKLSVSQFDRRLKEVVANRGKKGTELNEQLATLRKLSNYARRLGPAREIMSTMYLLGAQLFDTSNKIDRVMSSRHWRLARKDLATIVTVLEQNPGFTLAPLTSEDQADILKAGRGEIAEKDDDDEKYVDTLPKVGEKGVVKVSGDLAAFVERLSDEYTKSLQQTDPHTSEYISRLFDEGLLIEIAQSVQKYYERQNDVVRASNVALIRAELIYYKHDTIAQAVHESQAKRLVYGDPVFIHPACNGASVKKVAMAQYNASNVHPASISGPPTVQVEQLDTEKELRELCLYVFKHADLRSKTRAMLCRIYHHALHDRFHEARDLLLMSHIRDNITDADIPTQILFNRMMAQLGLSAFRAGLVWEAHACLSEICTGSRTKELLAQGMQSFRYQERDPDQERIERRRQVPYHMHINLELLESAHLVSAMLLEVPNMVNSNNGAERKRVVSKAFRKLLEFHERLVFEGPPENARDHVVAAAKLLAQGSWKSAVELLATLPVWDLFPGEGVAARVRAMVQHKIQVEALRTYLLAFSEEYDSVSLERLTEMFELDDKTVHSVVSKMMINEELHGAWDQSSQSIVLHKTERSPLQTLALQYSEKLSLLVENNERMMDLRSSNSKDDWNRRGDGGRRSMAGGDNRGHGSRASQGGDNRNRGQSQGSRSSFGGAREGSFHRSNSARGGRGGGRGSRSGSDRNFR